MKKFVKLLSVFLLLVLLYFLPFPGCGAAIRAGEIEHY